MSKPTTTAQQFSFKSFESVKIKTFPRALLPCPAARPRAPCLPARLPALVPPCPLSYLRALVLPCPCPTRLHAPVPTFPTHMPARLQEARCSPKQASSLGEPVGTRRHLRHQAIQSQTVVHKVCAPCRKKRCSPQARGGYCSRSMSATAHTRGTM